MQKNKIISVSRFGLCIPTGKPQSPTNTFATITSCQKVVNAACIVFIGLCKVVQNTVNMRVDSTTTSIITDKAGVHSKTFRCSAVQKLGILFVLNCVVMRFGRTGLINMEVEDVMAPNRCHAIRSNHADDSTLTIVWHESYHVLHISRHSCWTKQNSNEEWGWEVRNHLVSFKLACSSSHTDYKQSGK